MKNKLFHFFMLAATSQISMAADSLNVGPSSGGTANIVLSGSNSAAVGQSNSALSNSLTVGYGNFASGSSFATGASCSASNLSFSGGYSVSQDENGGISIAYGDGNAVFGGAATAVFGGGNSINEIVDPYSTAESPWSGGSEYGSLVAGENNAIFHPIGHEGQGNIVLGIGNSLDSSATGSSSILLGSVLLGIENYTGKTESWVMGKGNVGQTGAVVLGTYNAPVDDDASLIIGIGTGDSARANGLVVLKDGSVLFGSDTVLTSASADTYLSSHNYLTRAFGTDASLGSGLLAIGNSASTGYRSIALGDDSTASGTSSVTLGGGTSSGYSSFAGSYGQASGDLSIALGGASASGTGAIALGGWDSGTETGNSAEGFGATAIGGDLSAAIGDFSFSSGYQTSSIAGFSIALGSLNVGRGVTLPADGYSNSWVETDILFELGNGDPYASPTQYSNAITALKNGRTTFTNKFWNSTTPETVPISTSSSDGEALVVEGHTVLKGNTRLKGKVVMDQAQGDISMGIYE